MASLEGFNFSVFISALEGRKFIVPLLIIHLIISVILTIITIIFIPKRYRRSIKAAASIFLSILLLPIIGYFTAPLLYIVILRRQRRDILPWISQIPIEDITLESVKVKPRKFGESALQLFKREASKLDERAIFLLKELKSPIAVEIAKRALVSRNDEVRLTAFSLISKLEEEINEKISFLKKRLKERISKKEEREIYKKLALLYWELLYFNLVDKELERFVLDETLSYLSKALEGGEDSELLLLVGRIYLKKGEHEKAVEYLYRALKVGDKVSRIRALPYIAEVEFYRKNYQKVKEIFKELPLSLYPNIYFTKLLWEGKLKDEK
ncbi:tetratricopeptide repeat protein [Thermovibrio sp.]